MSDKTKIENINLLFACDKDWYSMTPYLDGRNCFSCGKKIIDFTDCSNEEFRKIYSSSRGNICGRFTSAQINSAPSAKQNYFMRIAAIILFFFGINLYSKNLLAQINDIPLDTVKVLTKDSTQEYFLGTIVEQMPSYKYGGEKGLIKFLRDNIIYPSDSVKGNVYVSFVVDKTGKLADIKLLRGLSPEADKEALRLTNLLEFNPGMQNGRPVSVIYNLPIKFTLGSYDEGNGRKKKKNKHKDD